MPRSFFIVPTLALFLAQGARAQNKPESLPALQILASIIASENATAAATEAEITPEDMEMEALSAPDWSRSWMLMNLSPETLELIQLNQDQNGKPLF